MSVYSYKWNSFDMLQERSYLCTAAICSGVGVLVVAMENDEWSQEKSEDGPLELGRGTHERMKQIVFD